MIQQYLPGLYVPYSSSSSWGTFISGLYNFVNALLKPDATTLYALLSVDNPKTGDFLFIETCFGAVMISIEWSSLICLDMSGFGCSVNSS